MNTAIVLAFLAATSSNLDTSRPSEVVDMPEVALEETLGIGVERAHQLGITPEMLAAHGVVASQAVEVLNRLAAQDWDSVTTISSELSADQADLAAAQDAYMKSRGSEHAQGIHRLRGEVEAGRAALVAALDQHRTGALDPLGEGMASSLAEAYADSQAGVGPALCILQHEPRDVQMVILAQIAERRAGRLEVPVPEWARDVLTTYRMAPAAVAAQAAIDTHLASIQAVYEVR